MLLALIWCCFGTDLFLNTTERPNHHWKVNNGKWVALFTIVTNIGSGLAVWLVGGLQLPLETLSQVENVFYQTTYFKHQCCHPSITTSSQLPPFMLVTEIQLHPGHTAWIQSDRKLDKFSTPKESYIFVVHVSLVPMEIEFSFFCAGSVIG